MNLRRWLDDAQGQLQNTQTALTLKEAEWKDILHGLQVRDTSHKCLALNLSDQSEILCHANEQLSIEVIDYGSRQQTTCFRK